MWLCVCVCVCVWVVYAALYNGKRTKKVPNLAAALAVSRSVCPSPLPTLSRKANERGAAVHRQHTYGSMQTDDEARQKIASVPRGSICVSTRFTSLVPAVVLAGAVLYASKAALQEAVIYEVFWPGTFLQVMVTGWLTVPSTRTKSSIAKSSLDLLVEERILPQRCRCCSPLLDQSFSLHIFKHT